MTPAHNAPDAPNGTERDAGRTQAPIDERFGGSVGEQARQKCERRAEHCEGAKTRKCGGRKLGANPKRREVRISENGGEDRNPRRRFVISPCFVIFARFR